MSVIEELIRVEADGTLSFGNYLAKSKQKLSDFEVNGDLYYVKTYNEITKLEKNSKLLLEAVPGATVHGLKMGAKEITFALEGQDDVKVTMELEEDKEYNIFVDEINLGTVQSNFAGKVNFSVDTNNGIKKVRLEKIV